MADDSEVKILFADEVVIERGLGILDPVGEFIEIQPEITAIHEQAIRLSIIIFHVLQRHHVFGLLSPFRGIQ